MQLSSALVIAKSSKLKESSLICRPCSTITLFLRQSVRSQGFFDERLRILLKIRGTAHNIVIGARCSLMVSRSFSPLRVSIRGDCERAEEAD